MIEQPKENNNQLFGHIKRINQETHMHTLLLGFQGDVTSFRLPKNVIGLLSNKMSNEELTQEQQQIETLGKNIIFTMEYKTLLDKLQSLKTGPTQIFECFLETLIAQVFQLDVQRHVLQKLYESQYSQTLNLQELL